MTAVPRERPLLIVSRCFGPDRCRYDGDALSCSHLDELLRSCEVSFVCPELAIGLPVPRDPARLLRDGTRRRMVQTATGRDLTGAMERFCDEFLSALDPAKVDGFILKSRSPSCALTDAKMYNTNGETPVGTGPGLFGAAVLRRFPRHPVADEEQLTDPKAREKFMERIAAPSAATRQLPATGSRPKKLP